MHYFQFNISDYITSTHHLSLVEDAIYSRLIRHYYAKEEPLINDFDVLARFISARTAKEKSLLISIVKEFFHLGEDNLWHHERIDEEIAVYQARSETNKKNAAKSRKPAAPTVTEDNEKAKADKNKDSCKAKEAKPLSEIAEVAKRKDESRLAKEDKSLSEKSVSASLTNNYKLITNNQDKDLQPNVPFDLFWETYGKKKSRKECEAKWIRLKPQDRLDIMENLKLFLPATEHEGCKYRPYPATYLNKQLWTDEITEAELFPPPPPNQPRQVGFTIDNDTGFIDKHTDRSWADE